jgi:glycosyltransferase involved in cell wall biosynthesis
LRGTAYSRSPPGHDVTAGTRDRRADLSEHAIEPPLVTIGVVSYNRLLYLRAMLESARECVEYPNLQWVVVDSGSTEPGLREYLEGLDFLDELEFLDSGLLADAMNRVVELARGECLMMLPEDVQFVLRGPWLEDVVRLVKEHPRVGHVCIDAQRRVTLRRQFLEAYLRVRGRRVALPFRRLYRRVRMPSGVEFVGYGRTLPGINTGGMSLSRTEIWRQLGPWKTTMELQLSNDAGLGTETEMLRRYARSPLRLERFLMRIPALAEIVTDPRGTKAKIRAGNRRYGRYAPAPEGGRYYRIWPFDEALERFGDREPGAPFEEIVEPIDFELPLDEHGDLLKVSVITDDEPYELVSG